MMSVFSSFDAFFAESYGQKLKFSKSKDNGKNNNNVVNDRIMKKNEDSGRSTSTPRPPTANDANMMTQQKQTKTKLPRFALELDGVNCFETIVPY
ncbi:hypothetical protein CICLE_v10017302mg [Citrus x clementina]|uniref:Uncharacterized protein n=1 Tax=Citrus clementina TaxID=85681 RepID=V4UAK0_CITCL|nr:hypothetical protein CICLE_v10017302mg [Citrus x clementina]